MSGYPDIPGYKIEHVLGEGGMATVYMATQEKLNRKVAIKILDPVMLKKHKSAERFLQEAKTAANLYHSNIISVFDVGQIDDYYYMVMEFLDGSLKDLLKSSPRGTLEPEEAVKLLKQLAPALDYAHSEGIIHRDIKPDNIMFRRDGTPVLVDFGIARAKESDGRMTQTGMSVGTPHYMSPEQCKADPLDGRSDFYSMGVLLHEMLTGDRPFDADTSVAVALKHLQTPIPALPEDLLPYQGILNKLLAKKKEDRVRNGVELTALIDRLLSSPGEQSNQPFDTGGDDIVQMIVDEIGDDFSSFGQSTTEAAAAVKPESPAPAAPPPAPEPVSPAPAAPPPEQPVETPKKTPTATIFADAVSPGSVTQPQPPQVPTPPAPPPPAKESTATVHVAAIKPEEHEIGLPPQSPVSTDIPFPSQSPRPQGKKEHHTFSLPVRIFSMPTKIALPVIAFIMLAIFVYFLYLGLRPAAAPALPTVADNQAAPVQPAVKPPPAAAEDTLSAEDESFNQYMTLAAEHLENKKYDDARTALAAAREIKTTPELETLEKELPAVEAKPKTRPAARKSRPIAKPAEPVSNQPKIPDALAFKEAKTLNTLGAYRNYLENHPDGKHLDEAIMRIDRLKEAGSIKTRSSRTHNLRHSYKTLSHSDVEAMLKEYGFFEDSHNKSGKFKGRLAKKTVGGAAVVVDSRTGLMWHPGGSEKHMKYRKIRGWLKNLNKRRYAGFSDWRLPTLEEAASLLRSRKGRHALYLDPAFSGDQKRIWTGDRFGGNKFWVVRFYTGIVFSYGTSSSHFIRPVRPAK